MAPSTHSVLFSRELFEVVCIPKAQRPDDVDTSQLIELLIKKDQEIQEALKIGELVWLTLSVLNWIAFVVKL